MKISSPSEIYITILDEVNNLIQSLKTETTDDEIRKSQEAAQLELEGLHREVNSSLKSLHRNAEWDVFCIAFYGETNAGKSTLIETLRILLNEPTKVEEQEKFKYTYDSLLDVQAMIMQGQNLLEQIDMVYQPRIIEFDENINIIHEKETNINVQLGQLEECIENTKMQIKVKRLSSFIDFFKALLGRLQEQQEILMLMQQFSDYQSNLITLNKERAEAEFLREITQDEWYIKNQNEKVSIVELQNKIIGIEEELSKYRDGKIIGDGHSDFTREVKTYYFEHNEQKFALLDLPGIEGKEDLVLNVINDAVQKAHAVFYISGKPTPPQTGDNCSEGTLEKIKKHLGQQTEVYSIFNKRIKNPQQLKPGLIDEDEKTSLNELDRVMRDRLGEHYENHIVLSAYPAFLSVANCWSNHFAESKRKFLEKSNLQGNLLQASLVGFFCEWLTSNLVNNCKLKIKKSNYKKITSVLLRTSDEINQICKVLCELQEKLLKNKKNTDNQLDEIAEILKQRLEIEVYSAVEGFKTNLRKNIYEDIDKEISNDEFKSAFEKRKDETIQELSTILQKKFESAIAEFKNEISDTIEKYHRYASDLLRAYNNTEKFDFDYKLNIDIKNNVNWAGTIISIVGSIAGVIICLSNPVGWVVIVTSILGAVVSVGKAVLGFFSHKYRASQQKRSADDNIEKMGDEVTKSIKANLGEAHELIQKGITDIKFDLLKSINHIKTMNQVFNNAITKFKSLKTIIEKEGDH